MFQMFGLQTMGKRVAEGERRKKGKMDIWAICSQQNFFLVGKLFVKEIIHKSRGGSEMEKWQRSRVLVEEDIAERLRRLQLVWQK